MIEHIQDGIKAIAMYGISAVQDAVIRGNGGDDLLIGLMTAEMAMMVAKSYRWTLDEDTKTFTKMGGDGNVGLC